jgi:choice-of-anchor B domain-containing protein
MRTFLSGGITTLLLLVSPIISFGQLNMHLQDSLTYTGGVNDVWGWVAEDGTEYALVGLQAGVAIVDVTKDTIEEVVHIPAVNNTWRDIKTYDHYAYVSTEANVGILIIDLQYLPDSVQTYVWMDSIPTDDGLKEFRRAHNLWIDEYGILYVIGSNLNNGGIFMLDVAADPIDPPFIAMAPGIYSHDCYVRDSIIYSAEIYAGSLSIYDMHDPLDIKLLGKTKTPSEFTHNCWLSDDGNTIFTTDERANAFITSYDISDPGNIKELDRFSEVSKIGMGNIPHNVLVWNDWVVASYYANGTIVLDGSRPDNLVQVGNFDSFLGEEGGFPGVWGTYPFLPSGKILSSDRQSGLYVFEPNYVRACFLEGMVIDSVTKEPINHADIVIQTDEIILPEFTSPEGVFKTGLAIPGQFNITITKAGYFDKTILGDFINGVVIDTTIELVPLPTYPVGGKVLYAEGGDVPFAKVTFMGLDGIYSITCDENGDFMIPAVYGGEYDVEAGVWGHTYETVITMDQPRTLTFQLIPGYRDDFDTDLGWTVTEEVSSGIWGRGIPNEAYLWETWLCGSDGDSPNDNGLFAYTTGLSTTSDVMEDEVSGGTTWLISPPMDLTEAIEPKISFDYWLCEFPPNQYMGLFVWVTNGVDTILLDNLINDTIAGSWQSKSYPDLSFIPGPLDNVRFLVSARDTTSGPDEYILKAHIDNFKLSQSGLASNDPYPSGEHFIVYPNPVSGETIYLKAKSDTNLNIRTINLFDIQGRLMSKHAINQTGGIIQIDHRLDNGIYLIQWITDDGKSSVEKVMILKG